MPLPINPHSYQLDHLCLTALTCGDKSKKPLLCLHGYLDNAASFLPLMQVPDILEEYYIIALEWPGHGYSDHRPTGAHYHFFDYVSDLLALFTQHNWSAIDIVGHSMGAMVASAFAAAFPEKVKSLTLLDAFGFISAPEVNTTKQLRNGLLSRSKPPQARRAFTEKAAIKARMLASDLTICDASMLIKRAIIATTDKYDGTSCDKVYSKLYHWRSDSRLRTLSPYRLSSKQAQQLFSDIKCPMQLIYGDKGMNMVSEGLSLFAVNEHNLTITKLNSGHHVHMEKAAECAGLLEQFLSKIKTSV